MNNITSYINALDRIRISLLHDQNMIIKEIKTMQEFYGESSNLEKFIRSSLMSFCYKDDKKSFYLRGDLEIIRKLDIELSLTQKEYIDILKKEWIANLRVELSELKTYIDTFIKFSFHIEDKITKNLNFDSEVDFLWKYL